MKQTTFLMIKPDGIKHQAEIIDILKQHNLNIEIQNKYKVDINIMRTLLLHYHEVIDRMGKDFNYVGKMFNSFYFGDFEIIPMKVSYEGDEDIIELTRSLAGATNPEKADKGTLRKMFSNDNYEIADREARLVDNVIHASDSHESAERELHLWSEYLNA